MRLVWRDISFMSLNHMFALIWLAKHISGNDFLIVIIITYILYILESVESFGCHCLTFLLYSQNITNVIQERMDSLF